jgi:hypothetical protein
MFISTITAGCRMVSHLLMCYWSSTLYLFKEDYHNWVQVQAILTGWSSRTCCAGATWWCACSWIRRSFMFILTITAGCRMISYLSRCYSSSTLYLFKDDYHNWVQVRDILTGWSSRACCAGATCWCACSWIRRSFMFISTITAGCRMVSYLSRW